MVRALAVFGLSVALISARAFADGDDVGIALQNGRLTTIEVVGEPPVQSFGGSKRVFGIDFAFDPLQSLVIIDEPGLASNDPALSNFNLGFNIRGAARRWDVTTQTFTASPSRLGVGSVDLAIPFTLTPTSASTVAGPTLLRSSPFDFHYDWTLNDATETTGQGVYLVELELTNPGGSFLTSQPLWLVFNYGLSEVEHDAAKDFVQATFVPAPGALGTLVLAAGCAIPRRRRASMSRCC